MKKPTAIDLFCGAGGLSVGLHEAGFDILAGLDNFASAGDTFLDTHPNSAFIDKPIEEVSVEEIFKVTGLRPGELDCLAGGPPCQAFSVYNHQRGMHDQRANLFRQYLRIVEGLKPKWVIMENVMGILSAGDGQAVDAIISGLNELGYRVEFKVLRAEEYGVPQERRRVVFMGNNCGAKIVWPIKTHGEGLLPFNTIYDAIGDLPKLENGEGSKISKYEKRPRSRYQIESRNGSKKVFNHQAPRLAPVNMKRMEYIPVGGSWRDIPIDLLPNGMKKARRCDHTKRYGRMSWDGLACTILTKCDIHWGAYIHPDQNRSITVREAARIQSFPDWFVFKGTRTEQYTQVGNAVPPLLAKALGSAVLSANNLPDDYAKAEMIAA